MQKHDGSQVSQPIPAKRHNIPLAFWSAAKKDVHKKPVSVGEALPEMPIFLDTQHDVWCRLEKTSLAAWKKFPAILRNEMAERRF